MALVVVVGVGVVVAVLVVADVSVDRPIVTFRCALRAMSCFVLATKRVYVIDEIKRRLAERNCCKTIIIALSY